MLGITWIIFILNPILGSIFVVLGLYKNRRESIHYIIMIALLFSSMAYWFIPRHEMDLTRYFDQLQVYNNLSWDVFVSNVLSKQLLFIQEVFFFGVAKTNNYHLLPAIVVFIVYFITVYMIIDYANRNQISSRDMFIVLIFTLCVLPYPSIVSNIRNILAFSVFSMAIYREFIEKKKNVLTVLLYLMPIFIHTSAVALVMVRIIIIMCKITKKSKIFISIAIIGAPLIIDKFAPYLTSGGKVTSAFFTKANNYINNTGSEYALYLQKSAFMKIQKIYFILIVIFLLVILITIYREKNRHKFIKEDSILMFYQFICFIVIGTIPIVLTVYLRFTFVAIMFSFLVLFKIKSYIKIRAYTQLVSIGIFLASCMGLVHQIVFTNQMTSITQMVTNVLIRSMFNMYIN